ncbi:MAG: tyrosine-type recombinase/integrase [Lautropia sp.]|nr:tyrosine-type recombinase/integrase [Lautropia sp.]
MRPKTVSRGLPPRMIRRTRQLKSGKTWEAFYYVGRGPDGKRVEIPLGKDLNEARRHWAELECQQIPADTTLMRFILDRYEKEILPTKAQKTQAENLRQIATLRKVFDTAPIESITPQIVAQYRDQRGRQAPTAANRELALLSHVWNMAREWGFTAKENPVKGVRKNKERPRDYYADSAVWDAVYGQACPELRDAMDLAYLTGQRPADVMKMRFSDIRDDALEVRQNKTSKFLRILLTDPDGGRTRLGALVDRIKQRNPKIRSMYLVATAGGAPLNKGTLTLRFHMARNEAAALADDAGESALATRIRRFQFRDIRSKAASETDLAHASKLLGHSDRQITQTVYRRVGETVMPTK